MSNPLNNNPNIPNWSDDLTNYLNSLSSNDIESLFSSIENPLISDSSDWSGTHQHQTDPLLTSSTYTQTTSNPNNELSTPTPPTQYNYPVTQGIPTQSQYINVNGGLFTPYTNLQQINQLTPITASQRSAQIVQPVPLVQTSRPTPLFNPLLAQQQQQQQQLYFSQLGQIAPRSVPNISNPQLTPPNTAIQPTLNPRQANFFRSVTPQSAQMTMTPTPKPLNTIDLLKAKEYQEGRYKISASYNDLVEDIEVKITYTSLPPNIGTYSFYSGKCLIELFSWLKKNDNQKTSDFDRCMEWLLDVKNISNIPPNKLKKFITLLINKLPTPEKNASYSKAKNFLDNFFQLNPLEIDAAFRNLPQVVKSKKSDKNIKIPDDLDIVHPYHSSYYYYLVECNSTQTEASRKIVENLSRTTSGFVFQMICYAHNPGLSGSNSTQQQSRDNLNIQLLNIFKNRFFIGKIYQPQLEESSVQCLDLLKHHWIHSYGKKLPNYLIEFHKDIFRFILHNVNKTRKASEILAEINNNGSLESDIVSSLIKYLISEDPIFRSEVTNLINLKIKTQALTKENNGYFKNQLNRLKDYIDKCNRISDEEIYNKMVKVLQEKIKIKWIDHYGLSKYLEKLGEARGRWIFLSDDVGSFTNLIAHAQVSNYRPSFFEPLRNLFSMKKFHGSSLTSVDRKNALKVCEDFLHFMKFETSFNVPEEYVSWTSKEKETQKQNIFVREFSYDDNLVYDYLLKLTSEIFFTSPIPIYPDTQLLDLEVSKQIAYLFFKEKFKILNNPQKLASFRENSIVNSKPCFFVFKKDHKTFIRTLMAHYRGDNLVGISKDTPDQHSYTQLLNILGKETSFEETDIQASCFPIDGHKYNILASNAMQNNSQVLILNDEPIPEKTTKKSKKDSNKIDLTAPIQIGQVSTTKGEVQTAIKRLLLLIDKSFHDQEDPQLRKELVYVAKMASGIWGYTPIKLSEASRRKFLKPFYQFLTRAKDHTERLLHLTLIEMIMEKLSLPLTAESLRLNDQEQQIINEALTNYPGQKINFLEQFSLDQDSPAKQERIFKFIEKACFANMYKQNPHLMESSEILSEEDSTRFAYTLFKNCDEAFKIRTPYLILNPERPPSQPMSLPCLITDQNADKAYIKVVKVHLNQDENITGLSKFDLSKDPILNAIFMQYAKGRTEDGGYNFDITDIEKLLNQIEESQFKYIVLPQHNAPFDLNKDPRKNAANQMPTLMQLTDPQAEQNDPDSIMKENENKIGEIQENNKEKEIDITKKARTREKASSDDEMDLDAQNAPVRQSSTRSTNGDNTNLINPKLGYTAKGKHNEKGFIENEGSNKTTDAGDEDSKGQFLPPPNKTAITIVHEFIELRAESFWDDMKTRTREDLIAKVSNEKMRRIAGDLKLEIQPFSYPIVKKLDKLNANEPAKIQFLNPLLKGYQKKDFARLYNATIHDIIPILAPEMGLGKTFIYSEFILQKIMQGDSGVHFVMAPQVAVEGIQEQCLTVVGEAITNVWRLMLQDENKEILFKVVQTYKQHKNPPYTDINDLFLDLNRHASFSNLPENIGQKTALRVYSLLPNDLKKALHGFQSAFISKQMIAINDLVESHLELLKKCAQNQDKEKKMRKHLFNIFSCYSLDVPEEQLNADSVLKTWVTDWNNYISRINLAINSRFSDAEVLIKKLFSFEEMQKHSKAARNNPHFAELYLDLIGKFLDVNPDRSDERPIINNEKGILSFMTFRMDNIIAYNSTKDLDANLPWTKFEEGKNLIVISSFDAAKKITDLSNTKAEGWNKARSHVQTLIFDEVQRFHTKKTKGFEWFSSRINEIKVHSPKTWISLVTGTPIENNDSELWALLGAGNPDGFDLKTQKALVDLSNKTMLNIQGDLDSAREFAVRSFVQWRVFSEVVNNLIIWRKRDSEVVRDWENRVPNRRDETIEIRLEEAAQGAIRNLEKSFSLPTNTTSTQSIMTTNQVQKIQAVLIHNSFTEGSVGGDVIEAKVKTVFQDIQQFKQESTVISALVHSRQLNEEIIDKNERAIVFIDLIGMGIAVSKALKEEFLGRVEVRFYNGSIESEEKKKIIHWFKDSSPCDKARILILSEEAGGVGINLPEAKYGFNLMRDYNDSAEDQAFARMDRVGSTGDRTIVHFDFKYGIQVLDKIEWETIRTFKHVDVVKKQKKKLKEFLKQANNPDLKAHFGLWMDYILTLVQQSALNTMKDTLEANNFVNKVEKIINILKHEVETDILKPLVEIAQPMKVTDRSNNLPNNLGNTVLPAPSSTSTTSTISTTSITKPTSAPISDTGQHPLKRKLDNSNINQIGNTQPSSEPPSKRPAKDNIGPAPISLKVSVKSESTQVSLSSSSNANMDFLLPVNRFHQVKLPIHITREQAIAIGVAYLYAFNEKNGDQIKIANEMTKRAFSASAHVSQLKNAMVELPFDYSKLIEFGSKKILDKVQHAVREVTMDTSDKKELKIKGKLGSGGRNTINLLEQYGVCTLYLPLR